MRSRNKENFTKNPIKRGKMSAILERVTQPLQRNPYYM